MAAGWGSLLTGDDMTINSTAWVIAEDGGADIELQLDPNQELHVSVEFNPGGTTDSFEFEAQTTVETGVTTEWDTTPILALAMGVSPDPGYRSFKIRGYYRIRFRGRQTGATDSSTYKISWRVATLS